MTARIFHNLALGSKTLSIARHPSFQAPRTSFAKPPWHGNSAGRERVQLLKKYHYDTVFNNRDWPNHSALAGWFLFLEHQTNSKRNTATTKTKWVFSERGLLNVENHGWIPPLYGFSRLSSRLHEGHSLSPITLESSSVIATYQEAIGSRYNIISRPLLIIISHDFLPTTTDHYWPLTAHALPTLTCKNQLVQWPCLTTLHDGAAEVTIISGCQPSIINYWRLSWHALINNNKFTSLPLETQNQPCFSHNQDRWQNGAPRIQGGQDWNQQQQQ